MQTASLYHEKHMASLSETIAVTQAPPYPSISINVTALFHAFNKYPQFTNHILCCLRKLEFICLIATLHIY